MDGSEGRDENDDRDKCFTHLLREVIDQPSFFEFQESKNYLDKRFRFFCQVCAIILAPIDFLSYVSNLFANTSQAYSFPGLLTDS